MGLGLASAVIAWRVPVDPSGNGFVLAVWLVVLYAGVLLSVVDVAVRRLPTLVIRLAAITAGTLLLMHDLFTDRPSLLGSALLAAAALGGGYALLALATGGGPGMGDVRLAPLLGLALGAVSWSAVLVGGLPALSARRAGRAGTARPTDTGPPPFGPFLVAGAVLAALVHNRQGAQGGAREDHSWSGVSCAHADLSVAEENPAPSCGSRRCALTTPIAQLSMSHPLSRHCMQRPVARCGLGGSECAVITRLAVQRTRAGVMGPSSMGTVRPPGASRSGHRSPIRCPDRYPRSRRLPTGGTWHRTCHG